MRDFQRQEVWVRRKIRPSMARAVRLTNDALRLGIQIIQKQRQMTGAGTAMRFLASRLLNDVRACELVAQRGYALQTLALTASAFELAYRALYIGNNTSRAQAWARHDDIRHSYPPDLKAAMLVVYREWGDPEAEADHVYGSTYKALAAAKHGNPKALLSFGLERADNVTHVFLGPVHEPATVRACQIALVECVRLLVMVVGDLERHHMPTHRSAFLASLTRLSRRAQRLGTALGATIRGGTFGGTPRAK